MTKKVLIYSACNDFNALELALDNVEQGNDVSIIQCDKFLKFCQFNMYGNPLQCFHCKRAMTRTMSSLGLLKKAHVRYLSDVVNADDIAESTKYKVDFNSVKDIKDLVYKGAEIGYGAFSSYVTFSRNVMPEMNDELRTYLSFLIKKEIAMYHALERLNKQQQFDQIIFHNGRFAQFKPFLEFAKLNNIGFITTEHRIFGEKMLKNNFIDDIPHSINYVASNVLKNWENGDPSTRETIGKSFFEKRRKGVPAGDKVYMKGHIGELPEGWDEHVENIVIFNSSEDEFMSVNKQYDSNLLFPNQYVALKTLFDHYQNDKTKHFYLRIHPNLKSVPFKSHLALYELKYDNVTIISADSVINSYTLLDHSDKVIIFNSTMGVEAEYWGKPVISLTKYFYWVLGMLYHPNNVEELWSLIDNKQLVAKKSDNLIKYGYWLLHPNYPEVSKVPYRLVHFKFKGKDYYNCSLVKMFGSYKLEAIFLFAMNKIRWFSKFKSLPCIEPYKYNG